MKPALVILAILLGVVSMAGAQVVEEWATRFCGPGSSLDEALDLALDSMENVYVTGHSTSDILTVKYSTTGEEIWSARYDGPAHGFDKAWVIAVDADANVYVAGYCASASEADLIVVKYDSAGAELWIYTYDGSMNQMDWAVDLVLDQEGHIFVTGFSTEVGNDTDILTLKLSPEGEVRWLTTYNGPSSSSDFGNTITLDASGNVLVGGESHGGPSFMDFLTIKYSPGGQELWTARYDGPGDGGWDAIWGIAADSGGNAFVTGFSDGNVDFDFCTIKYDTAGQELWNMRYNGPANGTDCSNRIALDGQGNIYASGGSIDSTATYEFALVKYSPEGSELWSARYGSVSGYMDYPFDLAVDSIGNAYLTGTIEGTELLESGDYATVKYSPMGELLWTMTYANPMLSGGDAANALALGASGNVYISGLSQTWVSAYDYLTIKYSQAQGFYDEKLLVGSPEKFAFHPSHPNPFNTTTVLTFDLPVTGLVKLEVFDIKGQRVGVGPPWRNPTRCDAGTHQIPFDGSGLPSGIYLARVTAGEFQQTQKLVLLR